MYEKILKDKEKIVTTRKGKVLSKRNNFKGQYQSFMEKEIVLGSRGKASRRCRDTWNTGGNWTSDYLLLTSLNLSVTFKKLMNFRQKAVGLTRN